MQIQVLFSKKSIRSSNNDNTDDPTFLQGDTQVVIIDPLRCSFLPFPGHLSATLRLAGLDTQLPSHHQDEEPVDDHQ